MKEQTRGKRLLSFLLCFVMIFGMLPMSAIPAQAASAFATEVILYNDGSSQDQIILNAETPYAWPASSGYRLETGKTKPSSATKYVWFDATNKTLVLYGGSEYAPLHLPAIRVGGSTQTPIDLNIKVQNYVQLGYAQSSGGSTSLKSYISNFSGGNIYIEGVGDTARIKLYERDQTVTKAAVGVYIPDTFLGQATNGSLYLCGSVTLNMTFSNDYCPIGIYVPGDVRVTDRASIYSQMSALMTESHEIVPIYASELYVNTDGFVHIYANNMGTSTNTDYCTMVAQGINGNSNINIQKAAGDVIFSFPANLPREGIDKVCGGTLQYNTDCMAEYPHNNQVEYIYTPGVKPLPSEIYLGGEQLSEQNVYMKNGDSAPTANSSSYNAYYDYSSGTLYLRNYNAGPILVSPRDRHKQLDMKIHLTGVNTVNVFNRNFLIPNTHAEAVSCIQLTNSGHLTIAGATGATLNLKTTHSGLTDKKGASGIYINKEFGSDITGRNSALTIQDNVTVNVEVVDAHGVYGVHVRENSSTTPYSGGTLTLKDSASLNVKVVPSDAATALGNGISAGNLVLNTTGNLTVEHATKYAADISRPADSQYRNVGRLYLKSGTAGKALNSEAAESIHFWNESLNYIVSKQRANTPSTIEYVNKIGKTTWTVANYGGTTDRGEVGEYLEDEYPVLSTKTFKTSLLRNAVANGTLQFVGFEHGVDGYQLQSDPEQFWSENEDTVFYTLYDYFKGPKAEKTLYYAGGAYNPQLTITVDKPKVLENFIYYAVPNGYSFYDTDRRIKLAGAPSVTNDKMTWTYANSEMLENFVEGTEYRLIASYGEDLLYSGTFTVERMYNIITFDSCGATGGDDPADVYLPFGETLTFPANPYTKEGFTFYSWMWDGDNIFPGDNTYNFKLYNSVTGQYEYIPSAPPQVVEVVWNINTPSLGFDFNTNKFTGLAPGATYQYRPYNNPYWKDINADGSTAAGAELRGKTVVIRAKDPNTGSTSELQELVIPDYKFTTKPSDFTTTGSTYGVTATLSFAPTKLVVEGVERFVGDTSVIAVSDILTVTENLPAANVSYTYNIQRSITNSESVGHYTIRAYYGTGVNDYIKSTQFTGNWEVAAPTGVTVSGTATSFNSDTEDVILQLIEDGATEAAYEVTVNGNSATYSIEGVLPATYTLKVMKLNHVTREYTVTVASDNVTQDVKIHLLGDVTGDGYVDMKDWGRMRSHINEINQLTDYALACADVTKDDSVDMKDWGRMRSHVNETKPLW